MDLYSGAKVPKKIVLYFELGVMKYISVQNPIKAPAKDAAS